MSNRATYFKRRAKFKRVNYDLHTVLGFYSLTIALTLTITGLIMGFNGSIKGLLASLGRAVASTVRARVFGHNAKPTAGGPGAQDQQRRSEKRQTRRLMPRDQAAYRQAHLRFLDLLVNIQLQNKAEVFSKGELINWSVLVELQTKKPLAKCQELFNF
jgi:uncharacterized iron-regulated membrane protein